MITIGELYDENSPKRKRMAKKYKIYRFFGNNQSMKAFQSKCAFCLTDFKKEDVDYTSLCSSFKIKNAYHEVDYITCSGCGQKWHYMRAFGVDEYSYKEMKKKQEEVKTKKIERIITVRRVEEK